MIRRDIALALAAFLVTITALAASRGDMSTQTIAATAPTTAG